MGESAPARSKWVEMLGAYVSGWICSSQTQVGWSTGADLSGLICS